MPSTRRARLSDEALDDVERLLQYSFEMWGQAQQDEYAAALDGALAAITLYPEIRRAVVWLLPGLRRYPVLQHMIYYLYDRHTDELHVARILHVRMDAR